MRGRKPVPTQLHKLRGTHNTTRHGKGRAGEPVAVGDLLSEPPPWMSESQQAGWRYAVENAPRGILKSIDRGVLAIWVEAEDRHRTATMMQNKLDAGTQLPLLTKDKAGLAVASPYLAITNRSALVMLKSGSELGFSPAARPRLANPGGKPGDQDDSPWAAFSVIDGGREAG